MNAAFPDAPSLSGDDIETVRQALVLGIRDYARVTELGASVHILDQSPSSGEALAMVRGAGANTGMGGPLEEVQVAAH